MGPIGGILGFLQGQAQQSPLWALGSAAATANSTNSYVINVAPVEPVPVMARGPETALEWLDRRVNEVRLPLAA